MSSGQNLFGDAVKIAESGDIVRAGVDASGGHAAVELGIERGQFGGGEALGVVGGEVHRRVSLADDAFIASVWGGCQREK